MNIGNLKVSVEVDTSKLTSGVKVAAEQTTKMNNIFGGFVVTLGDVMNIATQAGKVIVGAITSTIRAAGEAELAERRLADAMRAQGVYSDAAHASNVRFAQSLQDGTKYNDEMVKSVMQLLTTFGMHDVKLRETTAATADLASGMGIDLRAAAMLLGKAFAGETSTLSRYGIIIDESTPKAKRFEEALRQVQQRFGGAAKGEAMTFTGQIEALKNAFDDLKETIGTSFLPTLTRLIPKLNDVIKSMGNIWGYLTRKPTGENHMKNLVNELIDAEINGDKQRAELVKRAIEGLKKVEAAEEARIENKKKLSVTELANEKAAQKEEQDLARVRMDYDISTYKKTIEDKKKLLELHIRNVAKGTKEEIALLKELAEVNDLIARKTIAGGWAAALKDIENDFIDWKEIFLGLNDEIVDSFSDGFTDMLFEGKNFAEAMGDALKDLGRTVVRIAVEVILKTWVVTSKNMESVWNAAHAAMTAATTALQGAVAGLTIAAGPLAILLAGIAALFLIVKNNWEAFVNILSGRGDDPFSWIIARINVLVEAIQSIVKAIVDLINSMPSLDKISDQLSFDLPTWDELSDQLSFKLFASGTRYAPGGPAIINENGPELVDLPQGSKVYSARETSKMMGGGGNTINIYATVRGDEDWERIVRNKIIPSLDRYRRKTANSPFA